jgi:lysozyme|tara:strand:- start:364 stop:774 length:411 start_codon:yes stop_codon:yes gene_type:complete
MNKEKLIQELKRDEGVELRPYKCSAGFLTLGCGRNIQERGITMDESDYLLANDIKICEEEASKVFKWFPSLTDDRQRAIINMIFNLGLTKLLHFKKFLAAMEAEDWEEAGKQMLDSKWARQVGNRSDRLEQMIVNG